ncbi:MAG TPA: LysR family transcriptional regulator [Burkholderiaceae bacterium]|nr:LysR family transcriptional regulator [Burkholderiaceae bacterium]
MTEGSSGPDPLLMRLRFQHLRVLSALADAPTLHEAAHRLHTTQSAASKLLVDLERAFGTRLFERGRTGLKPTESGKALVARAQRLLQDLHAARSEQAAMREGSTALLRVGGLPLTLATLMPAVLSECRRSWPGLRLRIHEAVARQLLKDIGANRVDCGLGRIHLLDQFSASGAELWHDELDPEEIVAVGPPDHPLARQRRMPLERIHDHEWLLPMPGTATRAAFAHALQQAGQTVPRPALETDASFGTLLSFVRQFGFLTLLPTSIAARHAREGTIRVIALKLPMRLPPLAFICLRERRDVPLIARFRRIVLATARQGFGAS